MPPTELRMQQRVTPPQDGASDVASLVSCITGSVNNIAQRCGVVVSDATRVPETAGVGCWLPTWLGGTPSRPTFDAFGGVVEWIPVEGLITVFAGAAPVRSTSKEVMRARKKARRVIMDIRDVINISTVPQSEFPAWRLTYVQREDDGTVVNVQRSIRTLEFSLRSEQSIRGPAYGYFVAFRDDLKAALFRNGTQRITPIIASSTPSQAKLCHSFWNEVARPMLEQSPHACFGARDHDGLPLAVPAAGSSKSTETIVVVGTAEDATSVTADLDVPDPSERGAPTVLHVDPGTDARPVSALALDDVLSIVHGGHIAGDASLATTRAS